MIFHTTHYISYYKLFSNFALLFTDVQLPFFLRAFSYSAVHLETDAYVCDGMYDCLLAYSTVISSCTHLVRPVDYCFSVIIF